APATAVGNPSLVDEILPWSKVQMMIGEEGKLDGEGEIPKAVCLPRLLELGDILADLGLVRIHLDYRTYIKRNRRSQYESQKDKTKNLLLHPTEGVENQI